MDADFSHANDAALNAVKRKRGLRVDAAGSPGMDLVQAELPTDQAVDRPAGQGPGDGPVQERPFDDRIPDARLGGREGLPDHQPPP